MGPAKITKAALKDTAQTTGHTSASKITPTDATPCHIYSARQSESMARVAQQAQFKLM